MVGASESAALRLSITVGASEIGITFARAAMSGTSDCDESADVGRFAPGSGVTPSEADFKSVMQNMGPREEGRPADLVSILAPIQPSRYMGRGVPRSPTQNEQRCRRETLGRSAL